MNFQKEVQNRMKKSFKITALLISAVICCAFLSACGSGNGGPAAGAQPEEPPEIACLSDGEWVDMVWSEAIGKLSEEGALSFESGERADRIVYDEYGTPKFGSADLRKKYMSDPFAAKGKFIWAMDNSSPSVLKCGEEGRPAYATDRAKDMTLDRFFADGRAEAGTLLVLYSDYSKIEEGYYSAFGLGGTGVNRYTATTLVFVVDIEGRSVVHVEFIGTDAPGSTTENIYGKFLEDGAVAYCRELMKK